MSTSFEDVYQTFLNKITDSDLANLPTENLDSIMTNYLKSSIVRFRKCQKDLNQYDFTTMQFNVDLYLDEIEILANWMVYGWLDQQINRLELLRQSVSSKDFAMYSQAAHLDKMLTLKRNLYVETNQMITDYTYDFGKVDELR